MDPTLAELIEPFVSTAREPLWEALFEAYKALGNQFKEISRQHETVRVTLQAKTLEQEITTTKIQQLEDEISRLRNERDSHQCPAGSSAEALEGLRTVVNNLTSRISQSQQVSRGSSN
jgi:chromosome segregation ATPase